MARFLSSEWLAQLAAAAGESQPLRDSASGVDVSIRQLVRGGPDGDVAYTVRLARGTVTVVRGDDPGDVEVVSDYATAAAISRGDLSPAAAFASGRLKLGGNVATLAGLRGPNADGSHAGALSGLGDLFVSLRATTEY